MVNRLHPTRKESGIKIIPCSRKGERSQNIWQTALMTTSVSKAPAARQNLGCGDSAFHGWDWISHWPGRMGAQSSMQIKDRHSSCPQVSVDWIFHLLNVFELKQTHLHFITGIYAQPTRPWMDNYNQAQPELQANKKPCFISEEWALAHPLVFPDIFIY